MLSATEVQEAGAHVVDSVRSAIDVDSVRSAISDQVDTVRSAIDDQVDTLRSAIDVQVDALRSADLPHPIDSLRSTDLPHSADIERLARRRPWTFLAILLGGTVGLVIVAKVRAASKAKARAAAGLADRQTEAARLSSAQNGQKAPEGPPSTDDGPSPYLGAAATTS